MGSVAAAVLTGGAGRRMGGGKPLVEYRGVALASRVATALGDGGCTPVVAVGGSPIELAPLGLTVIADRWPGEGPLGGLVTACSALFDAGTEAVIVAACDLGRLDAATVRRIGDVEAAADVVVATTGRRHASLVRCSRRAAALAETWFLDGERRLGRVLDDDELRVVDCVVDEAVMTNVNAPGDLAR